MANMAEVVQACDRAIGRLLDVVTTPGIDYALPRAFVARTSETAANEPRRSRPVLPGWARPTLYGPDDLAAVKEWLRPIAADVRPQLIADGLWRVGGGFVGEYEDANVYLVDGGDSMALIGAGSGFHTRAIIRRILALGKNPLDIDHILLPSSHWYEARGANSLRLATQARVCAHRREIGALEQGDPIATGLLIGGYQFGVFPPCRVDRELEWGETLRVGKRRIVVLDAPGFHRGSTAFLMEIDGKRYLATGQAALGDLTLSDGRLVEGATGWLDPHWGGCLEVWAETLRRFIAIDPDVLLTGQGHIEKIEVDRQLDQCLARLDRSRRWRALRSLLPAQTFEGQPAARRPDISPLTGRRPAGPR
jgi:glyoxylase-like metal-dependent hydrolase (beta-lactamase superfamily II)